MTDHASKTPEQRRAQAREWYQRNRERVLAQRREYYEQNKDAVKARRRAYYAQNRDKILEYHREYGARNAAQIAEYQRAYKIANREILRAKQRARSHGPAVDQSWAALWGAQDGRCYLCGAALEGLGSRQIHIDHDHSCCPSLRSCDICRRGLACSDCNAAIGFAGDDPGRLRRMADALEVAQRGVEERKAAADGQPTLLDMT